MAVPKKRHSNSRSNKRRSHHRIEKRKNLVICSSCGKHRVSHTECSCGGK